MTKYPERCLTCHRKSIYIRKRDRKILCYKCGNTSDLEEGVLSENELMTPEGRTRKKILDVIVASERAAPGNNYGYGSVMYRQLRAACHYSGPIDAEIGRLHREGVVEAWTPGTGTVYIDFAKLAAIRPDVLKPGQAEELAKPPEPEEEPVVLGAAKPTPDTPDGMPGDF